MVKKLYLVVISNADLSMAKICHKAQADVSKAHSELQAERQKVADLENAEEPRKKKNKKVEWSKREIKCRD